MKLKYLGSAAAEGIPAIFCRCKLCQTALENGGKDIRTRSQTLINDDLIVDLPADTYMHVINNKLNLSAVKYLLITHSHEDHFYPAELSIHGDCYAHDMDSPTIKLFCNERVSYAFDTVSELIKIPDYIKSTIEVTVVKAFEPFHFGDYTATALPANHEKDENAFIYLIEQNGKSLLYAHDTGTFEDNTVEYLEKTLKKPLDMMSIDATLGSCHCWGGHMGVYECFEMADILKQKNIIDDKTIIYLNHFSHNGLLLHDELVMLAKTKGMHVSFDGCEVDF